MTEHTAQDVSAPKAVVSHTTAPSIEKDFFASVDFATLENSLEALLKAGTHFGHQKSRRHPRMQQYIFGVRNAVTIIDLEKTQAGLSTAQAFLADVRRSGKKILFVTTKKQMVDTVMSAARRAGEPYMVERWIGGTFTNFPVIRRRVKQLMKMEEDNEKGIFRKYTKLEQLRKQEEIEKLNRAMGGLKVMEDLPGAIVVVDLKADHLAVREARTKKIPVVALTDTNVDPLLADYAIPANDDALSSVRTVLGLLIKAIDGIVPNIAPRPTVKDAPRRAPRRAPRADAPARAA